MEFLQFSLFSPLHLCVLMILTLGFVGIYFLKSNKILVYFLAFVPLLQILIFHFKHIYFKTYETGRFLPFHLCTITAILCPIALLWNDKRVEFFKYLAIFWGFVPALLAILFPDMGLNDGLTSFRFWEFFGSHTMIAWSAFYIALNSDFHFSLLKLKTWKKIFTSFVLLLLLAFGIAYPINRFLGANYMYLMGRANVGMDFLPTGFYYLPALLGLSLMVFILEAMLFWILNYLKKTKDQKNVDTLASVKL
jgi:hypothetical integral membrane protein (TIGR02206 family)